MKINKLLLSLSVPVILAGLVFADQGYTTFGHPDAPKFNGFFHKYLNNENQWVYDVQIFPCNYDGNSVVCQSQWRHIEGVGGLDANAYWKEITGLSLEESTHEDGAYDPPEVPETGIIYPSWASLKE